MNALENVTAETFDKEVLRSPLPVLVDFYTTWCPGCRAAEPTLERLAEEYRGRARIVKVNVEEELPLAEKYQITAVPTLVFFRNGAIEGGFRGTRPEQVLRQKLEGLLEGVA